MRRSKVFRSLLGLAFGGVLLGGLALPAAAQQTSGSTGFLQAIDATRVADPKLDGGGVGINYLLGPGGGFYRVTITIDQGSTPVATVFDGTEVGSGHPRRHVWNGRNDLGVWVSPGHYTIRVDASSGGKTETVSWDLDLVRLGIVRMEAESTAPTTNEWQMVYFKKRGRYQFFATPATGEFLSIKEKGEVSDLDLDNGNPRPAPAVHRKTDQPVLEQSPTGEWFYDNDSYNYPLCYLAGSTPQLTVTFGDDCTNGSGLPGGVNYPVPGFELRCVADGPHGTWTSPNGDITPGSKATFQGPALSDLSQRQVRKITWRWQYRPTGSHAWHDVPGVYQTTHRFYTLLDVPYFASGATGTQYAGPWVEVAEYMNTWSNALGIDVDDDKKLMEVLIKGYFGQVATIQTAIENVRYDCPWTGGDGGATYYLSGFTMNLARLLDDAALGVYVNCSDCAGGTSTIAGMMGIQNVQMMRLGSMTLRAIWGIGCQEYTLDLWKGGHGFSYHHIITRNGGDHISDACLCVDEDGNPDRLPGVPGWNHDRPWNNYESLLATGNVTWSLDPLPKLK